MTIEPAVSVCKEAFKSAKFWTIIDIQRKVHLVELVQTFVRTRSGDTYEHEIYLKRP